MIDWSVAHRVAALAAGSEPAAPPWIDVRRLHDVREDAAARVIDYTLLVPAGPLPDAEPVGRRAWVAANLTSMRPLLEPLTAEVAGGLGPLGGPLRAAAGTLVAAQAGALAGYLSQRVLGQYEMALLDLDRPARLLFVTPNVEYAARQLGAPSDEMLRWVGFHEVTHAVQFTAVPWLREHLAALVSELIESVGVGVDLAKLMRLPDTRDLRGLLAALREGDLISLAMGPERRELLARLQAVMALVEGHAEHVMDAVGADALVSLRELRAGLERRRRTRPPLLALLERLIGLELKLRQYALGKSFCDAVVAKGGVPALNIAFESPEMLPDLAELETPELWLSRTGAPAAVGGE